MSYIVPKPNSRVLSTILSSILSSDHCHQPNQGVEVHVHDALESEIFDAQTDTARKKCLLLPGALPDQTTAREGSSYIN